MQASRIRAIVEPLKPEPIDTTTRMRLLAISGLVVLVLMIFSARYGYHRDELYFVAATEHPAWGYVDQPPMTIWIAWIAESLASGSVVVLRIFPALAMGAVVYLAGLTARALGGGSRAVLLGAAAVAASGIFLATGHLFSTTTFDILFWSMILYLGVRILGGGDPRLWAVLGGVAGLGLLNKHLVIYLLFGLLIGLLATRQRKLLGSRWPWLGALVALVIWSPNLIWQIQNDWPTFEMLRSLQEDNSGLGAAIEFLGLQLPFLSIVMVPIAIIGIRRMLQPAAEPYRPIAIGFLTLVMLMLVTGGKGYYIVPFYVVLLPMGILEMEERWQAGRARFSQRTVVAIMVAAALVMSPFFLPVVPAGSVSFFNAVNPELGETIGWEELVDQVAAIHGGFTEAEQRSASIFTGSYGEAGAIDLFGSALGLPPASSGHNAYWMWGPPDDGSVPVVVVGYGESWMKRECTVWEPAGIITNSAGIDNEEMGLPLAVCRQMRRPWSELWPDARHYN
jgi:4-amino-4-deoxy-L-arabinose transferase-like glycosyltransferase